MMLLSSWIATGSEPDAFSRALAAIFHPGRRYRSRFVEYCTLVQPERQHRICDVFHGVVQAGSLTQSQRIEIELFSRQLTISPPPNYLSRACGRKPGARAGWC